VTEILARPKKRLGQNFLVDKKVVADLVSAAELTKKDVVVEVGAGAGVLTKELAERAGRVFAFEIDHDLIPVLKKELAGFTNVEIVGQDFLKVDNQKSSNYLALHSAEVFDDFNFKLVGSIPYQITSPLIHKLLTFEPNPSLVVLLIQKEVAEKITAKPPKATYLSNIAKLLGEARIVRFVSKNSFWPVPEVDGAIVKWKIEDRTCLPARQGWKIDNEKFLEFLHRGFQNPRKMLRRKFDPKILEECGIAPTQRAQALELEDWLKLHLTQ